MDLQTLLVDRQIEVCYQIHDSLAKLKKAAKPRKASLRADCSAEAAVYTAALIAAAAKQLEYEAALQVASAAGQAYYTCMYGV